MTKNIQQLQIKIIPILKKYGIKRASLFGSYARGEQQKTSDIDLLIELPKKKITLFDYFTIKEELSNKLNKKVDLIQYHLIKPRLKEYILKNQIAIL